MTEALAQHVSLNDSLRVVDGHLHLWDPEALSYTWLSGRLNRRHAATELADTVATAPGADYSFVFVQADCLPEQSVAEVDWVTSLARAVGVRGIVARAPLENTAATDLLLAAYCDRRLVVGVRRMLQGTPHGFSATKQFHDSARAVASAGLVLDACVGWTQLSDVIALADAVPDLTIVLDHLGKPKVGPVGAANPATGTPWAGSLRNLALRANVVCKISGLPAESPGEWTEAQVRPLLDVALEAFGPDRLLFGSDWPMSRPYGRWLDTVSSWLEDRVGEHHRRAVLAENAERIYRLG